MKKSLDYYYLKMETHHIEVPYYNNEKRRIRVLLPKDYDKEDWANYPVVYMHDGQNVFYSKESYSGYSWKVIPTIKNTKNLPKLIIVGVDNSGKKRLDEYSPWVTDRHKNVQYASAGGDGFEYGEWLVNTVKPFIDSHYRTLPDAKNTITAGSSMGGIISAYLLSAYPDVFGRGGVFSLASWFAERDFLRFIHHHPIPKNNRIYIQVGTNEGDPTDSQFLDGKMNQEYIDVTLRYYQTLLKTGLPMEQIWLRILADETHHEKYWADHFAEFLQFVFDDQIEKFNDSQYKP